MSENGRAPDPTAEELRVFNDKLNKVPLEDMEPYVGKHVAWSLEARIVACGDDPREVNDKVVAAGIPPNRVVFDYIEDPDISRY